MVGHFIELTQTLSEFKLTTDYYEMSGSGTITTTNNSDNSPTILSSDDSVNINSIKPITNISLSGEYNTISVESNSKTITLLSGTIVTSTILFKSTNGNLVLPHSIIDESNSTTSSFIYNDNIIESIENGIKLTSNNINFTIDGCYSMKTTKELTVLVSSHV